MAYSGFPMTRTEFEALWDAEKAVIQDVNFVPAKGIFNRFIADGIEVIGTAYLGLQICMQYNCETAGLTCNFTVKGLGAIHRYCLNCTIHGGAGRFHEHEILYGDCVKRQLPHVVPRDDLRDKTTEERWRAICQEVNITFSGTFFPPEVKCV